MKKMIMLLLIAGVACSTSAFAKDVICKVTLDNQVIVNETCKFIPFKDNGSFWLTGENGLFQDIESFKVQITGDGVAKVYAEGSGEELNYWGKATRSKSAPACWNGYGYAKYQICAYAK